MSITLTARQIADLAEFAGLNVTQPDEDEADYEFVITDCPAEGVQNDGEPGDPDTFSHYEWIVYCGDCPEEGCMGLGPEIAAPTGAAE